MAEGCAESPFAWRPGPGSIPERPAITRRPAYATADSTLISGGAR